MAKPIKDNIYYTVYYWMSTVMGLSGVEKDLYALIYHYHKKYDKECYYSYSQLAEITGTYKNKVIRSLDQLSKDGLIVIQKKENGKNYYSIVQDKIPPVEEE